jgi:hypothetical protein
MAAQMAPAEQHSRAVVGSSESRVVASLLANAGFETNGGAGSNTFSGWTVVDQAGGSGSWFAVSALTAPLSGLPVPGPGEGVFQALTDQTGPGAHVLYQDIVLPSRTPLTLSFYLHYVSAASLTTPASGTLDYTSGMNQQFRVDVMDPAAGVSDVGTGVLMNVYRTNTGDATTLAPRLVVADLSAFAGRAVRIRFAETDNSGNFFVGVDAVSLVVSGLVPAAGTTGLLALGLATALAGALVLSRLGVSR